MPRFHVTFRGTAGGGGLDVEADAYDVQDRVVHFFDGPDDHAHPFNSVASVPLDIVESVVKQP